MSGICEYQIKQRLYLDSVALMRSSKALANLAGVSDAAMMMATPSNIEIMQNAGLLEANNIQATPADLIIAVRGDDATSVTAAMTEADRLLSSPTGSEQGDVWKPKSIRSAKQVRPSLNLALVSVPGAFAVSEARKALQRGLHVMIFSDNVPIEQEAQLKLEARELGLLVMGPDCGTAIINGVPLAFANKVPRGDIAIVGASGTGIQEIACLMARQGQGISQGIGVGGRDLHERVGGVSTLMAMSALENDVDTRHVVLVSKPPSAAVSAKVLEAVAQSAKTYTLCFLGGEKPTLPDNCGWAETLSEAARIAMRQDGLLAAPVLPESLPRRAGQTIHGLFCGGTLCTEALILFNRHKMPVSSNIVMPGMQYEANTHQIIDLGADEFTQGKPHPMIEPSIRDEAIQRALADANVGVLLLDVVIGFGAHSDPAGQLVQCLEQAGGVDANTQVIASVTGTDDDPQQRTSQVSKLVNAGVLVADSNEEATLLALQLIAAD